MAIRIFSVFSCVLIVCSLAHAEPAPITPEQRQAFEAIVHDYLLSHPDVLAQALSDVEKILKRQAEDQARIALTARRKDLLNDPSTPAGGNPKGDVTIVEFFDYRCPYCKVVEPSLEQLLARDHGVRFVYKEFPVLGPVSGIAARAALAANLQGKYEAFHNAMMAVKGPFDEAKIYKIAESVSLDLPRLKHDMSKPEIAAELQANFELARAIGVQGTPSFIIGQEIIPGAVDGPTLDRMIASARKQ